MAATTFIMRAGRDGGKIGLLTMDPYLNCGKFVSGRDTFNELTRYKRHLRKILKNKILHRRSVFFELG